MQFRYYPMQLLIEQAVDTAWRFGPKRRHRNLARFPPGNAKHRGSNPDIWN
jgi:hypothetical protein